MEAVDLTSPFSFGDPCLSDGGNEVKICKAATGSFYIFLPSGRFACAL
jgi:hypothetical protein